MSADRVNKNESVTQKAGVAFPLDRAVIYITATLVAILTIYVRVRLLSIPLERDEGEFAYFAQLMLQGIPPFVKAYTLKLPGAALMYALFFSIFGQSVVAIHLGLLVVNLLNGVMLFFMGRRLFDPVIGVVAASSYLLLSAGQGVLGISAHATHFVVLFALGGFLLLFRALESERSWTLFLSGFTFGLAIVMKQHGVFFALFALCYFLWERRDRLSEELPRVARHGLLFLAGTLTPYTLCALLLYSFGAFDKFWFWTVEYAREYVSRVTLKDGVKSFAVHLRKVTQDSLFLWIGAGVGLGLLFLDRGSRKGRAFTGGLLLFTFIAVCPGLYFRYHYFVMLLPAIALLIGEMVGAARNILIRKALGPLARSVPALFFILAATVTIYKERAYLFAMEPVAASKMMFGANPFPESLQVAQYIRDHTSPEDTIAILGSEPQIYFYANRIGATGHIYMYGLMENQRFAPRMQEELIAEIEAARPVYIVVVNVWTSWMNSYGSYPLLASWTGSYLDSNYRLVGIVDMFDELTVYRWDNDVAGYTPRSNTFLEIYRSR